VSYERSARWVWSATKGIGMYGMRSPRQGPTGWQSTAKDQNSTLQGFMLQRSPSAGTFAVARWACEGPLAAQRSGGRVVIPAGSGASPGCAGWLVTGTCGNRRLVAAAATAIPAMTQNTTPSPDCTEADSARNTAGSRPA